MKTKKKKAPSWWPFPIHYGKLPVPDGWKPTTKKQRVLNSEDAPF